MQVKRLKDVPESHKLVWLYRAPFLAMLAIISAYPENTHLRTAFWVMCLLDLVGSACDAGAVAPPRNSHEADIARNGVRMSGKFDFLMSVVTAFFASRVLTPAESFEITMLLGFGWYVRFSSWWFWDKAQAEKEEADIADGPFSEIPAHCDCRCEMPQAEINELAMSSGLRDGRKPLSRELLLTASPYAGDPRGDGDAEESPAEPLTTACQTGRTSCVSPNPANTAKHSDCQFPIEFARTVAKMHPQAQRVGEKIDVEV